MPSQTPPSRRALDLAVEQLRHALVQAQASVGKALDAEPPAPTGVDAALIDAVRQNDAAAAIGALKSGADANVGKGMPLRVAAENKNAAMMKELVIRGADVAVAMDGLAAQNRALDARGLRVNAQDPQVREALRQLLGAVNPRAGRMATDSELAHLVAEIDRQRGAKMMSEEDIRRRQKNESTLKTLKDWQARFLENLSPVEILRQQQKILDELDALKKELLPQKLEKPKLPAPKPPRYE